MATQRRFKETYRLPYPLLSDADGKVARQYGGVIPVVGLAYRVTYVVGQDGRIADIVTGNRAIDPAASIAACPSHH